MAPFQYEGETGIPYTSEGSLVVCGKKPGTRPQPQRPAPWNSRFDRAGVRPAFSSPSDVRQNEQSGCRRAPPDRFFSVSSTSIDSSYPAVRLCSWAAPCTVPAQLSVQPCNGRDRGTDPPKIFLGCFSVRSNPQISRL